MDREIDREVLWEMIVALEIYAAWDSHAIDGGEKAREVLKKYYDSKKEKEACCEK